MAWLGLHFADLALEVFDTAICSAQPTGTQPTSANPPVVVLDDNRVVCANAAAQQAGILRGATLATAHTIATDLVHYHKDLEREQQSLLALANSLYQLSSHISVQHPGGLLLEVSRSRKLFRSNHRLQAKAIKLCGALNHKVCARLGKTPAAAMALARSGANELGKVELSQLADNQPGFSQALVERCHNMGIYRLAPLLKLPRKALGQRFGQAFLQQLQRLTGALDDPQTPFIPAETFAQQLHLLDPIRNKTGLEFPMQRLGLQLQHWLVGRELAVQHIRWQFHAQHSAEDETQQESQQESQIKSQQEAQQKGPKNQSTVSLDVKFANPQRMCAALMNISLLKLAQQELPADILGLRLTAVHCLPWQEHSKDLFQLLNKNRTCLTPGDLVDQLRARLGDEACETLDLVDQHHPQWNWRRQQHNLLAGNTVNAKKTRAKKTRAKKTSAKKKHSPLSQQVASPCATPSYRPLWLLPEPKSLPNTELVLLQGPERIRTGWWQASIFRDYYIAQLPNGAHGWVFVDPKQQWYLHGYFA